MAARAPRLGHGFSTERAGRWIIVSGLITAAMYLLRMEMQGVSTATGDKKLSPRAILGSGPPPPLEMWIISYTVAYGGLAVIALGAPELAAAFAILLLAVNGINNGINIVADINGLQNTPPPGPRTGPAGGAHSSAAGGGHVTRFEQGLITSTNHQRNPALQEHQHG